MSHEEQEERGTPLVGGGLSEVVRIGDTVHRIAGPWTPAVQALLRHLETVGFTGAPRSLGFDPQGRDVLAWIDGASPGYEETELAEIGRLLRGLHDATASFAPPPGAAWQRMVGAPDGPVICHNDLSPDNLVRGERALTAIDWDLAAPGPRIWDVAWAAYRCVPLYDDPTCARLGIPVPDRAARLRLLADSYGLDGAQRRQVLPTVEKRLECLMSTVRAWAMEGRVGWVDIWRDTGGRQWQAGLAFVRGERRVWEPALT